MSYDVLIIHGSFGDPFGNWQPWLAQQATEKGKRTLCPHFPGPEEQNLDNWSRVLDAYGGMIDQSTTVFAHSLGPAFVLDYIAARSLSIGRFVAIAPFYGLINIDEFDQVNESFFLNGFDFENASKLCGEIHALFSDNDPYVPREMSETFARDVSAQVEIIPGGGHLNASAGFKEFPSLLKYLD